MTIQDHLQKAMKEAMRAKDSLRLSTIRMARTALKNAEIEARHELDETTVVKILSSLVKQRREAAELYKNLRPDLAHKEEQELLVLQEFLPPQLSETELIHIISRAIEACGVSSIRDMGVVMKKVTAETSGRADGRLVSELVRKQLSAQVR
jgi:uncharacterized protein YqeY